MDLSVSTVEREVTAALIQLAAEKDQHGLLHYQSLDLSLLEKYTWNQKQTLAFLLIADHAGNKAPGLPVGQMRFLLQDQACYRTDWNLLQRKNV